MPLVLSIVLAALLPAIPAAAQGAAPDEWRQGAGDVTDNFSRDKGQWTVDAGRDPLRSISRGRLTLRVPEPELFRWSTLDAPDDFGDFYLQVNATEEAGASDAMIGVIFRYEDVDNFYVFLISADGWYALLKYVDGKVSRPVDWTETGALETGEGVENTLGVLADGSELAVYANGEELERVQDRTFAGGQIALVAGTNTDGDLEVSFDDFGLWQKPQAAVATPVVGRKSIARPTATPQPPDSQADATVASDSLNVRAGPGTNYPVVGALKRGDGVKVTGRSADAKWARLGFQDVAEAWASAQYLTFAIDFAQAPVAKAPPAPRPQSAAAARQEERRVAGYREPHRPVYHPTGKRRELPGRGQSGRHAGPVPVRAARGRALPDRRPAAQWGQPQLGPLRGADGRQVHRPAGVCLPRPDLLADVLLDKTQDADQRVRAICVLCGPDPIRGVRPPRAPTPAEAASGPTASSGPATPRAVGSPRRRRRGHRGEIVLRAARP